MLRAAALVVGLAVAGAFELQSVHHNHVEASILCKTAEWWARVGERVFVTPPASMMQLGQNNAVASSLYYALGSAEALTPEMKRHRVGGEGRVHIFYLPEGPSALPLRRSGDRRAAFSSLVQLQHGTVLTAGDSFPKYKLHDEHQVLPEASGQHELAAAEHITPELYESLLKKVVGVATNGENTRSWTNPEASTEAQSMLQGEFKRMGLTACLQEFTVQGKKLANVIGFLPGSDRTSGTLTIGAHYDSRPFDNEAAPGAEDNGSGVAALLSIADAFMKAKLRPKKNLYFVGFAAEEPGLIGSNAFAKSLRSDGAVIIPDTCLPSESSFLQVQRKLWSDPASHSAIILDEVGWVSDKFKDGPTVNFESKDTVGTTSLMDSLYGSNAAVNHGQPLKVIHNSNPFGSDHMSWLDAGMPAVLVINGDDEAYPNYHKSSDTIDGNVNMDYGAKVSKMVLGGVIRIAGV